VTIGHDELVSCLFGEVHLSTLLLSLLSRINANSVKRVLIIGCCGSGKTTFAKELHAITGLDLIHLDKLYYGADWKRPSDDSWREIVNREIARDQWIIDGNYNGTLDLRLERADTVFFFRISTIRCLWNVTVRILRQLWTNETRDDVPLSCRDEFAFSLYKNILMFHSEHERKYDRQFEVMKNEKELHVFHTYEDVNEFLNSLRQTHTAHNSRSTSGSDYPASGALGKNHPNNGEPK
jgi:adenylate kinase family enzyme